jgi:hypothetical protein
MSGGIEALLRQLESWVEYLVTGEDDRGRSRGMRSTYWIEGR